MASEAFFAQTLETLEAPPEDARTDLEPDVFLGNTLRPIRSQGGRGTCVAHAVCAVFENHIIDSGEPPVDLSPQWLYWACKQVDGLPNGGTYIRVACERATSGGVCEEGDWPYNPAGVPGNEGQGPPPAGTETAAAEHVANGSAAVTPERSSTAICAQLDSQIPVALSVPVYAAWNNPTGKIPMPIPGAERVSGHAMCAAGYLRDPATPGGGYLVMKNSWGTDCAPLSPAGAGYFYLPFAYVDQYGWETYVLS